MELKEREFGLKLVNVSVSLTGVPAHENLSSSLFNNEETSIILSHLEEETRCHCPPSFSESYFMYNSIYAAKNYVIHPKHNYSFVYTLAYMH